MQTRAELLILFGPLASIMPRVFLLILAATASLMAATQIGRAVRAHRPLTLLTAWFLGCASAVAAYVGLNSLMAYGSPASRDPATFIDPLSLAGAELILCRHVIACVAAIAVGPLLAASLHRIRRGSDVSAETFLVEIPRVDSKT